MTPHIDLLVLILRASSLNRLWPCRIKSRVFACIEAPVHFALFLQQFLDGFPGVPDSKAKALTAYSLIFLPSFLFKLDDP